MKRKIYVTILHNLFCLLFSIPFSGFTQANNIQKNISIRIILEPTTRETSTGDSIFVKATENLVETLNHVAPADKKNIVIQVPIKMVGKTATISYVFRSKGAEIKRDVFAISVILEDSLLVVMDANTMRADVRFGIQTRAREKFAAESKAINERVNLIKRLRDEEAINATVYNNERLKVMTDSELLKDRFVSENPNTFQALFLLRELVLKYLSERWSQDPKELELQKYKKYFLSLNEEIQQNGQDVLQILRNAEEKTVPQFTGEMPDGSIFDLKSLKGKVVLIDFWGSWCIPCRKGHPHLKELYAQYKDKGFEIIGIGWERSGNRASQWAKLKKAIADDGIPWPQILHEKEKRDLASEYGVNSFPSKFLVDQNGKVVLRVGSDPKRLLDTKLKALLGK